MEVIFTSIISININLDYQPRDQVGPFHGWNLILAKIGFDIGNIIS